ncbi:MAG: glycosyltransferase family 4 protein [Chloroflexi bacterium]|nr:glycosyltransferase family 4 protein [Chloroflexota bacterium]
MSRASSAGGAPMLRIAQVAPPSEAVPPAGYGGTERVVHQLVRGLHARGHRVTTFAAGDSAVPGELVPTVERALRADGFSGDPSRYVDRTVRLLERRLEDFDVVHLHLEAGNPPVLRRLNGEDGAVGVATFHGRLDLAWARTGLARAGEGIVAVSASQAAPHPGLPWAVIPNGLDLVHSPFRDRVGDDLAFVGRITPEKGVIEAIELARLTGRRLRIAAKVGPTAGEQAFNAAVFAPALKAAGSIVEFLGELDGPARDELLAGSYATVMPGHWPEPFGLVAIESMATGTPVLAMRAGALPEIVRHGEDGFLGDDVQGLAYFIDDLATLDRAAIRASVLDRFSAERMVDRYEALYVRRLAERRGAATRRASAQPATARRTRPTRGASVPR